MSLSPVVLNLPNYEEGNFIITFKGKKCLLIIDTANYSNVLTAKIYAYKKFDTCRSCDIGANYYKSCRYMDEGIEGDRSLCSYIDDGSPTEMIQFHMVASHVVINKNLSLFLHQIIKNSFYKYENN